MNKLKSAKTKLGNEICLLGNQKILKQVQNDALSLVIGVFHGDEPQGKFLIEEYIKIHPECPLLFIPCLNPDGMQSGTRTNANGVDLNRNFPTKNWSLSEKTLTETDKNPCGQAGCGKKNQFFGGFEPASEIETKFLIDTIEEYKPDTILTLHAPYKVVNYDGPAKELAQMISEIMDYPVEENIGYPTPGSFGTYSGVEKNIKTITLELDETCPVEELISPVHRVLNKL